MLDDAVYPTYELLEIAQLARHHIHSIEGVLIWVAIPLALLPPIPIAWRWIWIRTIVITLVVWEILIDFRGAYEVPWNKIVSDLEKWDLPYDGEGGSVALFLVGWVFPFFECIITLSVTRFILMRIGRRRKTRPDRAATEQPATTGDSLKT